MKPRKILRQPALPLDGSMLYEGDAFTILQRLPSDSIQCIVTSPPYWGLRDYNNPDQIGLEETLPQFINRLLRAGVALRCTVAELDHPFAAMPDVVARFL